MPVVPLGTLRARGRLDHDRRPSRRRLTAPDGAEPSAPSREDQARTGGAASPVRAP
ncbi:MAG: hypothetical protein QOK40_1454, partial [Miltoncostaeaceae bacterium]|nr:hypothetical protein [Miltoncostaeaceae bacterium]